MIEIVGIAGGIGAGKTEVAKQLAARIRCPRASFGDYVRSEAGVRGLGTSREELADLGAQLIDELGWPAFVDRTLQSAGWQGGAVVVEGVRHEAAADRLREIAGSGGFALVFLDADATVRTERVAARRRAGDTPGATEGHSAEREVPTLRERAELVFDARLPVDDVVEGIEAWLRVQSTAPE